MSVDWHKFKADLAAARSAAETVPRASSDGGSANLDSTCLCIPRVRTSIVIDIARAVGLHCYPVMRFRTRVFLFQPPTAAQGAHRTEQAEAMTKLLQERGWRASTWSQVD